MSAQLPQIYLVRHGETPWSLTGQHTGRSDPPLTENGERQARALQPRLATLRAARVWCSPSFRARTTCALAGFGSDVQIDDELQEWDYGKYNGLKSAEIDALHPGWKIFHDGAAGGESVAQVASRADRVVGRLRGVNDNVLVFSSGHFLRALAARWINADLTLGENLLLDPTGFCILGYGHSIAEPAISLWNETFGRD